MQNHLVSAFVFEVRTYLWALSLGCMLCWDASAAEREPTRGEGPSTALNPERLDQLAPQLD